MFMIAIVNHIKSFSCLYTLKLSLHDQLNSCLRVAFSIEKSMLSCIDCSSTGKSVDTPGYDLLEGMDILRENRVGQITQWASVLGARGLCATQAYSNMHRDKSHGPRFLWLYLSTKQREWKC